PLFYEVKLFCATAKKLFRKININPHYYNTYSNPYMVYIFIGFNGNLFGVFQFKGLFSRIKLSYKKHYRRIGKKQYGHNMQKVRIGFRLYQLQCGRVCNTGGLGRFQGIFYKYALEYKLT